MIRVTPWDDPNSCGTEKRSRPSTRRPRRASSNRAALPIPPTPTTISSKRSRRTHRASRRPLRTRGPASSGSCIREPRGRRRDTRPRRLVDACVDPARGLLQRAAFTSRASRQDLGEDRERRLGRAHGADVATARPRDPLELVLVDACLQQSLAPSLLVAAGAERADVEGLRREGGLERRDAEPLLVRQQDDRRRVAGTKPVEHLVRPAHDQLVGARDALRGRELRTRDGDDRPPAELLRRGRERFGRVDRTDDDQARGRLVDVGEDPPALVLQHGAPSRPEEIADLGRELRRRVGWLALDCEPPLADALAFDDGEEHRAPLVVDDAAQPLHELLVGLLDEDVDLPAAGQADLEREVVRDPVREQARPSAFEHLLRDAVHLVLDTAARDGAGQLAAGGDAELCARRPRSRTPLGDDGGERESLSASAPPFDISEDLLRAPASSRARGMLCRSTSSLRAVRVRTDGRAGVPRVVMSTEARGVSKGKAKRELGWTPRYPSWRQGFAEVYAKPTAPTARRSERVRAAAS